MTIDQLEQLSEALADRLAAAAFVVAIRTGRRGSSGILWRDDVVVTSEQMLPEGPTSPSSTAAPSSGAPGRPRRRHQRRRPAPGAEAGRGAAGRRAAPPRPARSP